MPKGTKVIPYLRTENLKKHTLFRGTYLYSPYMGVSPPGVLANQLRTLQVTAQHHLTRGLDDSSHRTYTSAQRSFLQFCWDISFDPLRTSEDTLILFSTHLAQRIKPQSIPVYLATERSHHAAHGLPNPLQSGLKLKQTQGGIKEKNASYRDILADFRPFLNPSSTYDTVKWAAIATGHFLMLRASKFPVFYCNLFHASSHHIAANANLHSPWHRIRDISLSISNDPKRTNLNKV